MILPFIAPWFIAGISSISRVGKSNTTHLTLFHSSE
ncbi:UNVERIFIED_ORG: hypothetical protein M2154_000894 [Enterobacter sp. JUb101]|nr:hypothetical protein [Lelliottia amnigena]